MGCGHHVSLRALSLSTLLGLGRITNTQNNQGRVALQKQLPCPCDAMEKGSSCWEQGRMEATLGVTQSHPYVLQVPPEHRPIFQTLCDSAKGVTSHPLFPGAFQSSTPIQDPPGS